MLKKLFHFLLGEFFFFFLHFFHQNFAKIYSPKKLQNYTSGAVGTAAETYRRAPRR
jgi:hypothetical protein